MRVFSFIVLICAFACSMGQGARADDAGEKLRESRQQLNDFKKQADATQTKIDSLKTVEANLQKAIGNYNENVSRNRAIVDKLNRDLKATRAELTTNQQKLYDAEDRLSRLRDTHRGLMVDYYRNRHRYDFGGWDYTAILTRGRMSRYLGAVTGVSSREMVRADDSAKLLAQAMDSLSQTGNQISQLKERKRKTIALDLALKEQEQSNLGSVQLETNYQRDRLVSLSEMAQQMEEIIDALEKTQQARKARHKNEARYVTGSFSTLKGKLIPPIKGKIVSTFGWKTNQVTKLKSFSPGIDIQPTRGLKELAASASGRVVYVGNLRGYNYFVIVEHDDDYYTMYAGMSVVAVTIDEVVTTGMPLGTISGDKVHFEIRNGREHLDPVMWLDIDEF